MKNILSTITGTAGNLLSMTPIGGIVNSLVSGAGKLLLGKAAEKVGVDMATVDKLIGASAELSQTDATLVAAIQDEEAKRRAFELEFFGRAADLDPRAQLWRAVTRPAISWSVVGLILLGVLIQWGGQIFGFTVIVIPEFLVDLMTTILMFWFGGRTLEKVVSTIKG